MRTNSKMGNLQSAAQSLNVIGYIFAIKFNSYVWNNSKFCSATMLKIILIILEYTVL